MKARDAWLILVSTSTESRKSLITDTGMAKLNPGARLPVFCSRLPNVAKPNHFSVIITNRAPAASMGDNGIHLDHRPSAYRLFYSTHNTGSQCRFDICLPARNALAVTGSG